MIAWQDLGPEQRASVAESRLGGALGMITAASGALVVIGLGATAWALVAGQEQLVYRGQIWVMMLWAAVFLVMTLAKASATPRVATWLLFGAIALRGLLTIASYAALGGVDILIGLVALQAAFLLFELALAAGFASYMLNGIRPNLYYRGRVPVVGPG